MEQSTLSERIVSSFPPARLQAYQEHSRGGDHQAWALHTWNGQLAAAILETVNFVELALRNAIDLELRKWNTLQTGNEDWTQSPGTPLNAIIHPRIRGKLTSNAKKAQRRRNASHPRRHTPPNINDRVSGTTFGLWVTMLPEKSDARKAQHHEDLATQASSIEDEVKYTRIAAQLRAKPIMWEQSLFHAFPNLTQDPYGYATGDRARRLLALRNRASHMENLLYVNIENRLRDSPQLVNAIDPNYRDWLENASRIKSTNSLRPAA